MNSNSGRNLGVLITKNSSGKSGFDYSVHFSASDSKFKKTENSFFISTKLVHEKIKELIESKKIVLGDRLGHMRFSVNEKEKLISSSNFFPLGLSRTASPQDLYDAQYPELKKTGLASLSEFIAEMDLKKKFPGFRIKASSGILDARISMMRKRMRGNNALPIPLEEDYLLLYNYLLKGFREFRKKAEAEKLVYEKHPAKKTGRKII